MVRLTPFGKMVFAAAGVLLLLLMYVMFLKPAPVSEECQSNPSSCDVAVPAQTKPYHYPFRNSAEAERFRKKAKTPSDVCAFFSTYTANRGIPITFRAYVPPNAKQSPYYYADPDTGREFLPAYFIAAAARGVDDAIAFANEDTANLPPCASDTGGVILLGFAKGQRPVSPLVEVDGIIWWDSLSVNPSQQDTEAGAETSTAPVVLVGGSRGVAPSQASQPAFAQRVLNTAVGRGPAIIRVSRIEFADTQTRVWVELINKGNRPLPAWPGVVTATLREEGGRSLTNGDTGEGGPVGEGEEINPTLNDRLPDEPVPSKGGGSLKGYLVFPRVDASRTLFLSLPDFRDAGDDGAFPIVIRIPPAQ
jgi:hypothetical protein